MTTVGLASCDQLLSFIERLWRRLSAEDGDSFDEIDSLVAVLFLLFKWFIANSSLLKIKRNM